MTYIYVTFKTTNDALNFEENFKKVLPFWLVPVPRELSHSCGISARLKDIDIRKLEGLIKDNNLNYDQIHKITR